MSSPVSNDFVALRVGARFVVVTLFPNITVTLFIGGLVLAGAPSERPSWQALDTAIRQLPPAGVVALAVIVLVLSAVIHPLNYALIQLMEGYWSALPFGRSLQQVAVARVERHRRHLRDLRERDPAAAEYPLRLLPEPPDPVLPTTLGNVLYSGEVRAGARYGYETAVILPRLLPLLSNEIRAQITDTRNQLDAAARLCALSLLTVPVTLLLLLRHDIWLVVPLACYALAWLSYRSSVTAAVRFSTAVSVAFDLHHLTLWDALSLERPDDLEHEMSSKAPLLTDLLHSGAESMQPRDRQSFTYLP